MVKLTKAQYSIIDTLITDSSASIVWSKQVGTNNDGVTIALHSNVGVKKLRRSTFNAIYDKLNRISEQLGKGYAIRIYKLVGNSE